MADDAYPYPGVSQIETQQEWENYFGAVQLDGVVSGLVPNINSGARTASVGAGSAYLRGIYKPVTSTTAVPVPAAAGQDRVDRLVLRLDRDAATTATYILPTVVTGTPGTAAAPALTRGPTGAWELPICRWTSRSNGALTDLVDERYGPGWFTAAARAGGLVSTSPARVAVEIGTGAVYRSDGSTWTSVYQDTGWVELNPDWPDNWPKIATSAVRRVGNTVSLIVQVQRVGTYARSDPDGSRLVTLPQFARPSPHWEYFPAQFSGGITIRVQIRDNGQVWVDHPDRDVPSGSQLRFTCSYLV